MLLPCSKLSTSRSSREPLDQFIQALDTASQNLLRRSTLDCGLMCWMWFEGRRLWKWLLWRVR